ncbi:MAG TPA: hypothetical protein VGC15_07955 [Acetobacteraceae bacterium]
MVVDAGAAAFPGGFRGFRYSVAADVQAALVRHGHSCADVLGPVAPGAPVMGAVRHDRNRARGSLVAVSP